MAASVRDLRATMKVADLPELCQPVTPLCGTMRTALRPIFAHQITTYDEKNRNAVEDGL
jgi:hypothetical protein